MSLRIVAMASLVLLAAAPSESQEEAARNTIAVFAHPDDELFVAPALASATREGHDVTLVYATNGDQGPGVSGMAPGEELATSRKGEALCAAEALGVTTVHFLDLGDGTLGVNAHHRGSSALRFSAALKHILGDGEFNTAVTWGPDGGYGHSDHRIVSALTAELVQAMDTNRPKLLYSGIRKGSRPPEIQTWAETDSELLTVSVAYTAEDLAAATKAAQCHRTQFDADVRGGMMPLFDQSIWQGAVHFRPAFGT
ncbi:PIG-L family deacetylase [Pontixanthobacter sp. CEM42]|uniref:PIG-L deacetylase family protein n=1 Tax=Pontixanthobacter sp. CEM42 TaxID=2792077 RepID=UPI001AE0116C|nr:PIG-L family deacetylase [Pontixanthobacter sp. CEM42]